MHAEPLECFFGQATAAEARIYVQLSGERPEGAKLSGFVEGPYSEYAHTLPFRVTLRDLGPGETMLAEAIVPDPCFWSPEAPFRYRVEATLLHGDRLVETLNCELGVRTLAAQEKDLRLEGRRWVVRGGRPDSSDINFDDWHTAGVTLWTESPDDTVCQQASQSGILLIADLRNLTEAPAARLRRLARYPSVAAAVLPSDCTLPENLPRNLLLAEHRTSGSPSQPAKWADLYLIEADEPDEFATLASSVDRPVIAVAETEDSSAAPDIIRSHCDKLQRKLAPYGDYAGYVVRI